MKKFSMKKTTAAAVAAGVGAVLLLGGAGTLAYWSDTASSATQIISSGSLDLGNSDGEEEWTVSNGTTIVDQPLTGTIVPGDTITTSFAVPVALDGQNLKAELSIDPTIPSLELSGGSATIDPTLFADYISFDVDGLEEKDGSALTWIITPDDVEDGTVTVTVVVEFPFGTDVYDAASMNATLDAIELDYELKQIANN